MGESSRWRVTPGGPVDLEKIDARSTEGAPGDKEHTKSTFAELRHRLRDLQARLYAEDERSLLVVLQAVDAGGKDGAIKHISRGMNATGLHVTSFKQPSDDELAHDFLWRVHKHMPARGEVAVFNRSHYEDVLAVRVRGLAPEAVWRPRYATISDFERGLTAAGTTIVKLFLHVSKDEQAERFRARLARPDKRWKFRRADLDERGRWDDYQAAFAEAIERTSTGEAPWYVVPADRKWYRNWAISQILIETLDGMNPQYPQPEEGLDDVEIV